MQVEAFLENSAERFPDKVALVCGDQRVTYRWIDDHCNRISHFLVARGIRRGDRVAVCLKNSLEAILSIFAIHKAGAVFVLINPETKAEKLKYLLEDSGAKCLISSKQKIAGSQAHIACVKDLEIVVATGKKEESLNGGSEHFAWWNDLMTERGEGVKPPPKHTIDIDLAALIYTSGSTGNPKAVMMTHLNMVAAATSVIDYLQNNSDDIILNVLPLSSSYGLYQVLMAFKCGGSVVLESSFAYPHAVLQRLMDERVTGFAIVPTVAAMLLQMDLTQYQFPSLRYITNAGAALPTPHVFKLREAFPNTLLYLMYGLTECKRVSYLPPSELDHRPNSVGKAIPNTEAYIVDENGQSLPAGEVGELVVRGSNVMKGYWNLPEETARVLKPDPVSGEHVLHTGDLFRMDEEGYLYWEARRDDIIKCRGEKVSPREIENVLYALEGVSMAAVVGIPDPILGQAILAVVTLKDGASLTTKDVLRHCAKNLEDFMVPTGVEFRAQIPQTVAGKIDRRELAQSKV
jgi:amino acid adenylation domain-containing protein